MQLRKDYIKELFKDCNLNKFCRDNNINRETLSRIVCPSRDCKDMEVSTAYKIAKGFKITLDELIERIYSFDDILEEEIF